MSRSNDSQLEAVYQGLAKPNHTLIKFLLVILDSMSSSGHSIKTLFFTSSHVQIAKFGVVSFRLISQKMITYSMQRQGSAGIQNSVLSLESSKRCDILVLRVCSTNGRWMILNWYGSFGTCWTSLSWLLELLPNLPNMPFRAVSILSPILRAPDPRLDMSAAPLLSLNELDARELCSVRSLLEEASSSRWAC